MGLNAHLTSKLSACSWRVHPLTNLPFPGLGWKASSVQLLPLLPFSPLWHMCLPSPGSTCYKVPEVGRRAFLLLNYLASLGMLSAILPPATILPMGEVSATRNRILHTREGVGALARRKLGYPGNVSLHSVSPWPLAVYDPFWQPLLPPAFLLLPEVWPGYQYQNQNTYCRYVVWNDY